MTQPNFPVIFISMELLTEQKDKPFKATLKKLNIYQIKIDRISAKFILITIETDSQGKKKLVNFFDINEVSEISSLINSINRNYSKIYSEIKADLQTLPPDKEIANKIITTTLNSCHASFLTIHKLINEYNKLLPEKHKDRKLPELLVP